MSTPFIRGLQLARLLHAEAVRPLLAERFPGLPYTTALIGPGSEVLGFDTPRSVDHDWGPRLQVFVADDAAGTRMTSGCTCSPVSGSGSARKSRSQAAARRPATSWAR